MAFDSADAAGGGQGRRVALLQLLAQAQNAARRIRPRADDAIVPQVADYHKSTAGRVVEAAAAQSLGARESDPVRRPNTLFLFAELPDFLQAPFRNASVGAGALRHVE